MPKLYSSREIVKVLQKQGFVFVSQEGSHAKYRKVEQGVVLTTIIQMAKKEIPPGTFSAILRQTRLTKKHFK